MATWKLKLVQIWDFWKGISIIKEYFLVNVLSRAQYIVKALAFHQRYEVWEILEKKEMGKGMSPSHYFEGNLSPGEAVGCYMSI